MSIRLIPSSNAVCTVRTPSDSSIGLKTGTPGKSHRNRAPRRRDQLCQSGGRAWVLRKGGDVRPDGALKVHTILPLFRVCLEWTISSELMDILGRANPRQPPSPAASVFIAGLLTAVCLLSATDHAATRSVFDRCWERGLQSGLSGRAPRFPVFDNGVCGRRPGHPDIE